MRRLLLAALALLELFFAIPAHAVCTPYWQQTETTIAQIRRIDAGDFNGDGRAEIVVAGQDYVALALVSTDGTINPTLQPKIEIGGYLRGLAVGDVNGDTKLDILLADIESNTIITLLGNGDATFAAPIVSPVEVSPSAILLDDIDEDGKLDVVFRGYAASEMGVWKGAGDGTFAKLTRTPVGINNIAFATGDLDGDGFRDVVVSYINSATMDILFGNGDGTFDTAVPVTGSNYARDIAVADLDEDGDQDLVTVEWDTSSMTIVRNNGARTFAAPTTFVLEQFSLPFPPNASEVVAADVNDDDNLDLLVAAPNGRYLATFLGRGDGTFDEPSYAFADPFPVLLAVDDFTGDGRLDVAVAENTNNNFQNGIWLFRNNCGDSRTTLSTESPLISVGQTSLMTVYVRPDVAPLGYGFDPNPPDPTGTVKIMEGATELASGTLQNGTATIPLSGLGAGDHVLTAVYVGDSRYSGSSSTPLTHKVTTDVSTTTLTSTVPDPLQYGASMYLKAQARDAAGNPINGLFRVWVDGVAESSLRSGNPADFQLFRLFELGPHTFRVDFLGTDTVPPSTSNTITRTVVKAVTTLSSFTDKTIERLGTGEVEFRIFSSSGRLPTGSITLYEGNTVVSTAPLTEATFTPLSVASLPVGKHFLRAVYSGDAYLESSELVVEHAVVPNDPLAIDVSIDGSAVRVSFFKPQNISTLRVMRFNGGTWTLAVQLPYWATDWTTSATAGTAYIYRAEAYNDGGALVATSNVDVAIARTFTDHPLRSGMTVKAAHFIELRDAINALRTAANLTPITLPILSGGLVRASDLAAMRAAIADIRTLLGMPAAAVTDTLTPQSTPVRAVHIQQLRDALR